MKQFLRRRESSEGVTSSTSAPNRFLSGRNAQKMPSLPSNTKKYQNTFINSFFICNFLMFFLNFLSAPHFPMQIWCQSSSSLNAGPGVVSWLSQVCWDRGNSIMTINTVHTYCSRKCTPILLISFFASPSLNFHQWSIFVHFLNVAIMLRMVHINQRTL